MLAEVGNSVVLLLLLLASLSPLNLADKRSLKCWVAEQRVPR
jgi:hypothetical protein